MDGIDALLIGENEFDFHRFDEKATAFATVLERAGATATLTTDRDALAELESYDVLVDYLTDPPMDDHQTAVIDYVRGGGGYVGVHCASDVGSFVEPQDAYADLVGGRFVTHPEQSEFGVEIVDADHPITEGLSGFSVYDEPYQLEVDGDVRVLARMDHPHEELAGMPVVWTRTEGDGSVAYCSLGHTDEAMGHETVRELLVRSVEWATGRA